VLFCDLVGSTGIAAKLDSSWYGWPILLIAAAGEALTDDEHQEFKRLAGREREPGRIVRELIAIFGRRAGKSTAMAMFAISLAWATIVVSQARLASCFWSAATSASAACWSIGLPASWRPASRLAR
jgi:hypothetical protein